ncbi:uncharacterized protein LOC108193950 [Daucus carota subsp. sativus]|uniref:uncharacterized protein LOC108193950 n=1 Tax=Daucus carota subsp. sativus TaxID=79200 RepID=UPI003083C899
MIKRRFFKHEHGDKDAPSDSSSSSSDDDSESEVELQSDNEEIESDDNVAAQVKQSNGPGSSSSGYESEDSSAHEVDLDSPGILSSEDDVDPAEKGEDAGVTHLLEKRKSGIKDKLYNAKTEKDEIQSDLPSCVLKSKSVFKCKICPRIICLTEETLRTHLTSKRHSRSEKLYSEGRLKIMLNSDGELEAPFEEEETHQERHAATLAAAAAAAQSSENSNKAKKKNRGRQRQRMRAKKKTGEDVPSTNTKATKRSPKKTGEDVPSTNTKATKRPPKKRRQT